MSIRCCCFSLRYVTSLSCARCMCDGIKMRTLPSLFGFDFSCLSQPSHSSGRLVDFLLLFVDWTSQFSCLLLDCVLSYFRTNRLASLCAPIVWWLEFSLLALIRLSGSHECAPIVWCLPMGMFAACSHSFFTNRLVAFAPFQQLVGLVLL